ncbi:MAG: oligosaccharide flippase family protein [Candidatus Thermoplasmatota archaeon]|nr:oligosaccharide flippase family protein [Candidatus Thermoplasmatota archaeon]
MPSAKRVIARNTIANTLITIWSKGMAFFLFPLIVSRVSIEGYGVWLMVGAITGYFGLFDFGVTGALVKYIAQYNAKGDKEMVNKMVSSTFFFHLLVGAVIAGGLVVLGLFFENIFVMDPSLHYLARYIFFITAVASLTSWPMHSFGAVLPGLQRYDINAGLGFASSTINAGATIVILLMGYGLVELIFVQVLIATLMPVATIVIIQRLLPYLAIKRKYMDIGTLKKIFRFSSVLFLGQIATLIVYGTDTIVLGAFVGVGSIVLYSVARKLEEFAHFASGLPASALLPAATEMDALGKKATLQKLIFRGSKYKCAMILSVVVVIIMLADHIILFWMGSDYVRMTIHTQVFLSYWLLLAGWGITGSVLLATERYRPMVYLNLGNAAFNIVLSLLLVHLLISYGEDYGILAVILGTVIPNLVMLPLIIPYGLRLAEVSLKEFAKKVWLKTYPMAGLTALILWFIRSLYSPRTIIEVGLICIVGMSIFWSMFYIFGLEKYERTQFLGYLGLNI